MRRRAIVCARDSETTLSSRITAQGAGELSLTPWTDEFHSDHPVILAEIHDALLGPEALGTGVF